jgi:hypothetical protein
MAEAVVGRPFLRVGQHRIGLVDFLEPGLRLGAAVVSVGMVGHGLLAEGGLEIGVAAGPLDLQHLVIATRH